MKSLLTIMLLAIMVISCSHKKKSKSDYSPMISFQEKGKNYQAKILLPNNFKEKIPLVVIVHEWWGRTPYIMNRAQMITKEGYAALPVDLFGNEKTVSNPTDAQALATPFYQNPEEGVELLRTYIEKAKKDPHIDSSKIYVIGYCFGGTQALNLARTGYNVAKVVSFHGGLTSTYPTKDVKADVLVFTGGADPMVPKKDVEAFKKEMKKANANFEVVTYPDATHAFTNPNATEVGNKYNIPIKYNKEADEASWKKFLEFLKK